MVKKKADSLEETQRIAEEIVTAVFNENKKREGALVFALCGELGSGKTSFTQGIGKALGVNESIISPTFILERVYAIEKNGFTRFIHIDCYRFKESSEIEVLGWKELIKSSAHIIVVEWAEKIREYLPKDAIEICFEHDGEKRTIEIKE
ncbi:MAG TPA: tRNA (adenosine(37)-N6)-threonylcarbamoyltransferase complex ATPase subunit type 1 TsaE [Candidatus Paceibacterota bacterium]